MKLYSLVSKLGTILLWFCTYSTTFGISFLYLGLGRLTDSIVVQLHREQFSYRFSVFPDNFTMIYKKKIEKIGGFQKKLWQLEVAPRKLLWVLKFFEKISNFRTFSKTWFFDFNRNSFENRKILISKNFKIFEIFSKFSKFSIFFEARLY